jgi:hypothetical protein
MSGSDTYRLLSPSFQSLSRQLVRGIGPPAHVANDAVSAACPRPDFMDGIGKRLAGRKPAAHDGGAIGAHHDTMKWPASSRQIEGSSTDLGFQLCRTTLMGEAEGLGVHSAPPDKDSQATAGPAIPVECGIDVDHEALSQPGTLHKRDFERV